MMKWSHAINTALASILVLPAIALQGDGNGGLEKALRDTVRSLEYLSKLETRVAADPRAAVPLLQSATETPIADPRERDELLVVLRNDVARLQMVHDDVVARGGALDGAGSLTAVKGPGHIALAISGESFAPSIVSTGLSVDERQALSSTPPAHAKSAPVGTSIEDASFCADPARRGQALYRAGRYDECVRYLEALPDDPRAVYWLARALEKLGRIDEALTRYRIVAADAEAGALAQRAASDLEFLDWHRQFAQKVDRDGARAPLRQPAVQGASEKP